MPPSSPARPPERPSLRSRVAASADPAGRRLHTLAGEITLDRLLAGSVLGGAGAEFAGGAVLLATRDHAATAAALVELDGVAARLVLGPADLGPEHLPGIVMRAGIDAVVSDRAEIAAAAGGLALVRPSWPPTAAPGATDAGRDTEWVLATSGTTGVPKLVAHGFAGLTAPLAAGAAGAAARAGPERPVWATFYDIRRYGGLQMLFRGLLGTGSLALSGPGETIPDFLARLAPLGVTHLAGTPSHWRRALMSPALRTLDPAYIRLSGEIADAAVLAALRAAFPRAAVGHAYASTEAGVAFEVNDGREGFPAALLGRSPTGVEIKVEDGTLRIRSARVARAVLGDDEPIAGPDGFVDTGDVVERDGDRCRFAGRRGGVINVGGLKVHPEEVEAVLNRHPGVRMAQVEAKRSPITGALVSARIVPRERAAEADTLRRDVQAFCRAVLPPHKVPALLQVVEEIAVGEAGKLVRGPHG